MIAYVKGKYDGAIHLAKQWALQNDRSVVAFNKRGWHTEHDIENKLCFVIGPKGELPDCNNCVIFAYGHKPPHGMNYIKIEREYQSLTFQDFVNNYTTMGDKRRDPEYAVMMTRYINKNIVASWLYINYEERRKKIET